MDNSLSNTLPQKPVSLFRMRKALESLSSLPKPAYSLKKNQLFTRQYVDPDKIKKLLEKTPLSRKRKSSDDFLHPEPKKSKSTEINSDNDVGFTADQAIDLQLYRSVEDTKNSSDRYDQEGRFLGPQFLEQQYFLSLQEGETKSFRLCRPWSLIDLLNRMATFKLATWRCISSGLDAPSCAKYGWVNVSRDVIKCFACEAQIETPTESSVLVDGHFSNCLWRSNFCSDELYSIPQFSFWGLAEAFQSQLEILASHLQDKIPKVEHSLDELLIKNLLQKCAREDNPQNQALVVLHLCGWYPVARNVAKLPGPSLRCWMCHRQLGCWNFASHSSDSSNLEKDRPLLEVVSQHRPFCPYTKLTHDGKSWPQEWLERVASSYFVDGKITCTPPWSNFPIDGIENKPFDWEAKKRTVSRFRELLNQALAQDDFQKAKRQYISRSARFNTLSSSLYLTPDLLTESIKSRFANLKKELDDVSKESVGNSS